MMLKYQNLDWKIIITALLLSLIGIVLIMSAQYYADSEYQQNYYERQAMWLGIALFVFLAIIHLPLRFFDFTAYLLYGVTFLMLVLVLFIGSTKMGATRWFSFGPINLAPSDIAKLTLIFALSRLFAYSKMLPSSKRRLAISSILTLIPMMLILKQPDLGTSLVFPVILFVLWFWTGLSTGYLILILSPLVALVAGSHIISLLIYLVLLLAFLFVLRPGLIFSVIAMVMNLAFGAIAPVLWNRMPNYQKLRLLTFLDPGRDPRGAGYQIIQSKIAIGSGGVFGKGFLNGSQSRLEFLPERHTDFIFSVLGEEFGMVGSMFVVMLFGYLIYRAVVIAGRCRSKFSSNIVIGAVALLAFQFLVNIGMTLGFMPVTGLALPFLSYGGTSLVLAWSMIGLIVLADYRWQEY